MPSTFLQSKSTAYTATSTASTTIDKIRDERMGKLKHELRDHIRSLNDYEPLQSDG